MADPKAARKRAEELAAEKEASSLKKKSPRKKEEFHKGFAEKWAECFKNNESLIHIDLSKNNIEAVDVEIMA